MTKEVEQIDYESTEYKNSRIAFYKERNYHPVGWYILVELYKEPQMQNGIYRTDKAHEDQKYTNCVGLVIELAKGVYKDARYADTGQWCAVGDYIVFPRHAGIELEYLGNPIFMLEEDRILGVLEHPNELKRS